MKVEEGDDVGGVAGEVCVPRVGGDGCLVFTGEEFAFLGCGFVGDAVDVFVEAVEDEGEEFVGVLLFEV